jgi:hypothetical protein
MSARFGVVDILAATAKQLNGFRIGDVGKCNREKGMVVAENSRAASEIALFELFQLFVERYPDQ